MAMRLSGLMSGMDTDSLIQELVAARRIKVDKEVKAQTKHEWKQEAWKDLNTKLKNLQTKYLSNMRFKSSYMKKTTKVSNSAAVSVITGENAVNGVQDLQVNKLAKTAYLTGAQIQGSGEIDTTTKLSDLGIAEGTTIGIKGKKALTVTADTTISDVLTNFQEAGLNANFDVKNQRFFVSAKESGGGNDFTIVAREKGPDGTDVPEEETLKKLGLASKTKEELAGMDEANRAKYATKIEGQNAQITLNGATFTSNTNVFEINGLTFTALSETKEGESVTITTQDDVDGIYDMVKNFLKEYNAVINEMDKLYNADSAKGYEPMTDEEKEALSETEVEKYEKKIKDALLSGDSNLSSVGATLKGVMSSGIEVNGKTMYLSDFGIEKLSYFVAPENERNAYHIAGDPDDGATSGDADKLKSMISSDPNAVVDFFSRLSKNLYDKMDEMSASVKGYRSYGSFYDDKKMQEDYNSYKTKIAQLEKKLADYEDKWYKKFADMETAMAKMQSNTSAVTSLLGGV